jgi:hypothetical protein
VENWGVNSQNGKGVSFLLSYPDWIWDPPSLSGALSLGVTYHSTVSGAEIKNAESHTTAYFKSLHGTELNPFTAYYSLKVFLKYCNFVVKV